MNPALHANALQYRADIDGLRAIAVLAVVAFHAFPKQFAGGYVGVDVFFVISGYLISSIIFNGLEQGRFSFFDFYARRIRRIFPALILVLTASYAFGWFALLSDEYRHLGKHIAAGAGFVSNFVLWNEAGYFDAAADTKPMLHLWSLGIEEQYYFLWPLLLYLMWKFRVGVLAPTLLVFFASFLINMRLVHIDAVAAFYSPAARFWELMAGGLLAYFTLFKQAKTHDLISRILPRPAQTPLIISLPEIASSFGMMLIVIAIFTIDKNKAFPGWWALLPTLGAMLLIMSGPGAWLNRTVLSHPALVWIGLISFPLYLWHWPLLSFARITETETPAIWARALLVTISFVLAWLTYKFVEQPIRHGGPARAKTVVLCALMAMIGLVGLGTFMRDGLAFRAANEQMRIYAADITAPAATRDSDLSCPSLLGIKLRKNEVCLSTSAHPDILVIGDSHAMALNSAAYLNKVSLQTLLVAEHGCLPFESILNHGPGDPGRKKNCGEIAAHVLEVIKTVPSLKTVLISSRDLPYIGTKIYGPNDDYDRQYSWKADPESPTGYALDSDKAFVQGYSGLIRILESMGKTVVFSIDNPELGIDPRKCIELRPVRFSGPGISSCTIPRSAHDIRQKRYRQLVQELKSQHSKLVVFDPTSLFCDNSYCYGKRNDRIYYFDGNHLNISGSEKVLNALKSLLE